MFPGGFSFFNLLIPATRTLGNIPSAASTHLTFSHFRFDLDTADPIKIYLRQYFDIVDILLYKRDYTRYGTTS